MKRVKIMLTAIAVFATVGGALAFKAKSYGTSVYCSHVVTGFCNVQNINATITTNPLAPLANCVAAPQNAPCSQVRVTTNI